jgi:hypothetical protein
MNETEWMACQDPQAMLDWWRHAGTTSARKVRLTLCAECRCWWHRLDQVSRAAVLVAERYADGTATDDELRVANEQSVEAKRQCVDQQDFEAAVFARCADVTTRNPLNLNNACRDVTILRHIIGNPFRPLARSPSWPTAVSALAQAVYDDTGAAFALADALLEAGHPDLAAHFKAEAWHPKGCWALDAVLERMSCLRHERNRLDGISGRACDA